MVGLEVFVTTAFATFKIIIEGLLMELAIEGASKPPELRGADVAIA